MTAQEAVTFIVTRWLYDHAPAAIALQLLCLGCPMKKTEVLAVIRRYVDVASENTGYGRRR